MSFQTYVIKTVNSHVEVFDSHNVFVQSADSYEEAIKDLRTDYEQ
jgi:hypothetical protein